MRKIEISDLKTLTRNIIDIKGKVLKKGLCFFVGKNQFVMHSKHPETITIYLDNGTNFVEDFSQHIVNKNLLDRNSI